MGSADAGVREGPWKDFYTYNFVWFNLMADLLYSVKSIKNVEENTPLWQKFVECADGMFYHLNQEVLAAIEELKRDGDQYWLKRPEGLRVKPYFAYQYEDVVAGRFSFDSLLTHANDLIAAGVDSTSNTIMITLSYLAKMPDVAARMREELFAVAGTKQLEREHFAKLKYLKAFIRETHRLCPTNFAGPRILAHDVELTFENGRTYKIPKGVMAVFSSAGLHYDPKYFENPLEFKVERWLDDKLADDRFLNQQIMKQGFGIGPRMCIGARLADWEIRAFLAEVVRNVELSVPPGEDSDWEIANRLFMFPSPPPNIIVKPLS